MGVEPRTYSIDREKARKAYFKLIRFFGLLIAFNLFVMALPNRGHHPDHLAHYCVSFALIAMLVYLIAKMRPDYSQTVEVSEAGIAWSYAKKKRISIGWNEMGAMGSASNRPGFFILNKAGTKKIMVNQWFDGFDHLKAQVQGEREKNSSDEVLEVQVFPMPGSIKGSFLFAAICFSVFCVGSVVFFLHEVFFRALTERIPQIYGIVTGGVSILMYGPVAYYCWTRGSWVPWSKIEVGQKGIARLEKDGRKIFVGWEEMTKITLRNRMRDLSVQARSGERVVVDYQFEGFERIRDRIFQEFEERVRIPDLPVTYGALPVLPNLGLWVLIGAPVLGLVYLWRAGSFVGQEIYFWILELFFGVIFGKLFVDETKRVKALTIRRDGLVLHRLFGKLELGWREILAIDQKAVSGHGENVFFFRIRTTRGDYSVGQKLNSKAEVFLTAKRALEEAGRGQ